MSSCITGVVIETFVTFVYGNCDRDIESISSNSLHSANRIIIQKCLKNTINDIKFDPQVKNVHCRSFDSILNELHPYIKKEAKSGCYLYLGLRCKLTKWLIIKMQISGLAFLRSRTPTTINIQLRTSLFKKCFVKSRIRRKH